MPNPVVFFDITIGGSPKGRVEMELRADVVPRTAEVNAATRLSRSIEFDSMLDLITSIKLLSFFLPSNFRLSSWQNFRCLCTGEKGQGRWVWYRAQLATGRYPRLLGLILTTKRLNLQCYRSGKLLFFKGSSFHRTLCLLLVWCEQWQKADACEHAYRFCPWNTMH